MFKGSSLFPAHLQSCRDTSPARTGNCRGRGSMGLRRIAQPGSWVPAIPVQLFEPVQDQVKGELELVVAALPHYRGVIVSTWSGDRGDLP
jgi:hypothetical protein